MRFIRLSLPALFLLIPTVHCIAADSAWTDIPASQWKDQVHAQDAAQKPVTAVIASPANEAQPLVVVTADAQAPGLYEARLTLRPSHVAGADAFQSRLRVNSGTSNVAEFPGEFFARVNEPEYRTFQFVNPHSGPLNLSLQAYLNGPGHESVKPNGKIKSESAGAGPTLTPEHGVYYLVDKIEFRLLSRTGQVSNVQIDKIRYNPGDTLKGSVTLTDAGGNGGQGNIVVFLEHNVKDRTQVQTIPVKLASSPQNISFQIPLPKEELGYALVAEYVSADGADHSEAAEYFTIAANFSRVAIFGANPGGTRDSILTEDRIRPAVTASRTNYFNACEYPFWAEDDLLAMSPKNDSWFSGQANYHYNKQTLQAQIRLSHEQGIAMVTYGKWDISGPAGWEIAYDHPIDFQGAYFHPVAMWEGVDGNVFDCRRNGEQVPYAPRPGGQGWFDVWWNQLLGFAPDATPANVRRAAEETIRSIDMFGWDGIRWDGHPRAGGPLGGGSEGGGWGPYSLDQARKTQSLLRYFKDIIATKYPAFGHGYNYYFIQDTPSSAWAYQDYELDEAARGGGLLMNESIGNASNGRTFGFIANNLQVEGDLSRERGGYLLGISFASSPRDMLVESALWAAAGCRPYSGAMSREIRRYCTRYAQYTFDENLRRLATPEKILSPDNATRLWWQPFVYETPSAGGKRQLVVNLLNIPRDTQRSQRGGPPSKDAQMPPGTDPVTFSLTLPAGIHATGANLIDPQTLEVTPLDLQDGHLKVPAVANWSVAVIDLAVDNGAPSLGDLYGPAKTLGMPRPGLTAADQRPQVVLDPKTDTAELNKELAVYQPEWSISMDANNAAVDALPLDQRPAALLKIRAAQSPEALTSQWWKGGSLPDDLKLKDNPPTFGDLSPRRDGRFNIYYGRGAMDYRLRMPEIFAGLDRFSVYDAPLWGGFRGGSGGMGLSNGLPWSSYPKFDLLLFTSIPHCAIGAMNCYAMVQYVKDGGSVFFTGGEYAFGKGGYIFTVLERDLLPVLCTETKDTRTSPQPLAMEPGKDFSELHCKADFSAKPSFWVYNQVVVKDDPGIKVFVTSAKGPVLVGWQVGKGRVACLLVDHRGKSENGATAFFDWADWPGLARAVFAWLAPDAGKIEPPAPATTPDDARKLISQLALSDTPPADPKQAAQKSKADQERRVAALRLLLSAPKDAIDTTVVLNQLLRPGDLPDDVRWSAIDCVLANPPATFGQRISQELQRPDSVVRETALQCLGAVDPDAVLRELGNSPKSPSPELVRARMYALTLTLPLVETPALVEEGRARVEKWNASEKAVLDKWTDGKGFSAAAPELPGLDAESILQRIAWLAYLSRQDPKTYGAQFTREWLMTATYQGYCGRSMGNRKPGDWVHLSDHFARLRDLTRPDVESLINTQPDVAGQGLARAHFTLEFRAAMNLLGERDRASTATILSQLRSAGNPDLAAFATERLQAGND